MKNVEEEHKINSVRNANLILVAFVQSKDILKLASFDFGTQFLQHAILQVTCNHPTGLSYQSSHFEGKEARTATDIQNSHSLVDIGVFHHAV